MPKTKYRKKNNRRRRTHKKGGKGASDGNVTLSYKGYPLGCAICGENNYEEVISTLGKSKIRKTFGNMVFGEAADNFDNTSVIAYFCLKCGNSRMIRNNNSISIIATKNSIQENNLNKKD